MQLTADGHARWCDAVRNHESYLNETDGKSLVFVGDGNENSGEMLFKPYTHRWTERYTKRQYARMQDFVRGTLEEYENPYIVILPALTASSVTPTGEYRPPIDHFRQLKHSWSRGVRYELAHSMNATREKDRYPSREWEYLGIWEPTTDMGYTDGGYAHFHPVVVCDGKVGTERFRSVIEKHVEKCEWASPEAHDVDEIDIRPLDELSNPAAYLFKYLGKSWNRSDSEPFQRRFDAILYETGYRRIQVSDGAQEWMRRESDGAKEPWTFAGIGDESDLEELRTYQDAHEFRIANEMGVSTWLSGYDAPDSVETDERRGEASEGTYFDDMPTATEIAQERCEHPEWSPHRCVSCGASREEVSGPE